MGTAAGLGDRSQIRAAVLGQAGALARSAPAARLRSRAEPGRGAVVESQVRGAGHRCEARLRTVAFAARLGSDRVRFDRSLHFQLPPAHRPGALNYATDMSLGESL